MIIACPCCLRQHLFAPIPDDVTLDWAFHGLHLYLVKCPCGWLRQIVMTPVVQ